MKQTLVIAEKPAMGRDIATALAKMHRCNVQNEGLYQRVGSTTVIGAQGHLFALRPPEAYGEEFGFPWKLTALPVLPERFELEPNFEREKGKVVESSLTKSIRARLSKIKELIAQADEVVHAGDPDREGQLIIDDILRFFNWSGPVTRLWLHAQTTDGIEAAWRKMKRNQEHALLGISAVARRESDWAIGMNATRAFSATWWRKGHKGILNIGRVVTPIVGMLVQREKEIDAFTPIDHYTLKATIALDGEEPYQAMWVKPEGEGNPAFDPSGKLLIDKSVAEAVHRKCVQQPAHIVTATKTAKSERAPLLFSLTGLQKMAAKMGYAPDEVLAAAQALYEKHKLLSYPRTSCEYAPESEHARAPKVLQTIASNFAGLWQIPPGANPQRKSPAWNDAKLAEHYAIIPLATSCPVQSLTKCELDVYRLVCRQYLAQFFPDFEFFACVLIAEVAGEKFKATGRVPTQEGWKSLFGGAATRGRSTDPESDAQDSLPDAQVGDTGIAKPIELASNKTEPPKRFTSITLLEAMEKAYLFVTDPNVKAKLKQVEGIGTEATRASIIARAISTGLAGEDRSGKVISYYPTPKAFGYIQCVTPTLTRPDLTAWFEGKLEELATGTLDYPQYRSMLTKLVNHVIAPAKDGSALTRMPSPEELPQPVATGKRQRKSKEAGHGARPSRPRSSLKRSTTRKST